MWICKIRNKVFFSFNLNIRILFNLYYDDKISFNWKEKIKKRKKENKNIINKEEIKEKDLKQKDNKLKF